jgi:hypothetical protein
MMRRLRRIEVGMIPCEHGESCQQGRDQCPRSQPRQGCCIVFERRTRHGKKLGSAVCCMTAAITSAVAQDAKSLLEAADKAMGASAVKSVDVVRRRHHALSGTEL